MARASLIFGTVLLLSVSGLVLPARGASGAVVEITLYGRDVPTPGWSLTPGNQTDPGPTIQVNLGDEIRLRLVAEDGLPHVFYIDYDGSGLPTIGLEPISSEFSTETMLNFTADQAGFHTYWCAVHQPDMSGGWITNGPPVVTVTSPTPGVSWTGGTDHDIVLMLTDEDILQNTKLWVNFTYAGGAQGNAIAGPVAGAASVVVPWTAPFLDAMDVRVNSTAIDTSGARGFANSAAFEVDSTPPSVEARFPGPGAQDVPRNARVEVRWSEGMNETSSGNPASFGLRNAAEGSWVPGGVAWDEDSRTLVFTPSSQLAADTIFEVHVNASARDDSEPGNVATGPMSWTFQTSRVSDADGPSITEVIVSPTVAQPGELVSIGATITDSSDIADAWIVIEGPDLMLNITLVRFGDQWFLNRSWDTAGTYGFAIGAQDTVGNVNATSGSFQVQGSLTGTFGLIALFGTLFAVGVGVLVYLWIRRRPTGPAGEA